MGEIIRRKVGEIRPRENKPNLGELTDLFVIFKKEMHQDIFPVAIMHPENIIIDGHHRLILADLFDVKIDMHLVKHKKDFLNPQHFVKKYGDGGIWCHDLGEHNLYIEKLYNETPLRAAEMANKGINTFQDLRRSIGCTDVEKLEKYLSTHHPKRLERAYKMLEGA